MSHPYANLLGALKEGYFFKCGDKHRSWKQRWFVLTKDILYYFEKETSTEPLGIIPLKDYQRCKGMEGDALQATRKENSFYLQTPYRMYKAYCQDWKTSESWANSIEALGEFLKKRDDIRKPTRYQQEVLQLSSDVVNFGSSLIHWFKLVVDSTPSYKNGIRSIYASAIYDIPADLGAQTIFLAKAAIAAIGAPNNAPKLESLKYIAEKVLIQIEKAEGFVVCCADTHKGKFNADLDVMRKAVKGIIDMKPMFPLNEVTEAAIALCKTAYALCKPYVMEEDAIAPAPSGAPSATAARSAAARPFPQRGSSASSVPVATPEPAPSQPITPGSLLSEYKAFSRVVSTNLETLKSRPVFPTEQGYITQLQSSLAKVETATTELVTQLQLSGTGAINERQVVALYHDLPAGCRDVISHTQNLFTENM